MEERTNDIRVRCRLSILRLYPAHRQADLTDRTDFSAWKAENVAHMQKLLADPSADIDQGWPDPKAWERKTAAASMLDELEAVQQNIKNGLDDLEYKFKVPFLQVERHVNEDLSGADLRLFEEYQDLEVRRPLDPDHDNRWRYLQSGLFSFKG